MKELITLPGASGAPADQIGFLKRLLAPRTGCVFVNRPALVSIEILAERLELLVQKYSPSRIGKSMGEDWRIGALLIAAPSREADSANAEQLIKIAAAYKPLGDTSKWVALVEEWLSARAQGRAVHYFQSAPSTSKVELPFNDLDLDLADELHRARNDRGGHVFLAVGKCRFDEP